MRSKTLNISLGIKSSNQFQMLKDRLQGLYITCIILQNNTAHKAVQTCNYSL